MSNSNEKKAVTIRFSPDELETIERLCERYNVPQTTFIRWAVEALVAYTDFHGGNLHLPIDLSAEWEKVQNQPPSDNPQTKVSPTKSKLRYSEALDPPSFLNEDHIRADSKKAADEVESNPSN